MRRIPPTVKRLGLYLGIGVLGFVVGVFALYIIDVRNRAPLEPWHTAELTAEFTAERSDEIRSFDDYRELEDRVFAQLKKRVYARIGTGSAYALVRYSAGSAADPRRRIPNWNRSYELAADRPKGGVLLLHGMSDSPYSLRALGEALNRHGYWVLGLRLPGHGTAPSGLTTISWRDLTAVVRLGMRHLASKVGSEPIHIVGYSIGASLAIDHALDVLDGKATPAPASLVLISPAVGISRVAAFAKWKARLAILPGLDMFAWTSIQPEFDPYKYNSFATNAAAQAHILISSVTERIKARAQSAGTARFPPVLALKSTVDATVTTGAVVDRLLNRLAPNQNELVLFDINRVAVKSSLLIADPGPLTGQVMADAALPFAVTLITNGHPESRDVVARRKAPFSAEVSRPEPLNLAWPRGVISLSHVALPFPPDDALYGWRPEEEDTLFLGEMAIKGERGLLKVPGDWLMRLRSNPFYGYLETQVIGWVDRADGR